jgi:hypothetical protein
MSQHTRSAASVEGGILATKIDGVLRLAAILSAFILWYLVAIVLLVLHSAGVLPGSSLVSFAQAATTAGLAPIPVALATWKFFEWAFGKYLTAYTRSHFQHVRS